MLRWSLLFLALALPARAAEPSRLRAAVFDLRATNVEAALVENLSELLTDEFAVHANATVISRAEVVALLGFEKQRMAIGCDEDVSCAAELAGALGVDRLVTGSLGKVGETWLLSLRIIDVKHARVTARTSDTTTGTPDELLAMVRRATPTLVAQDAALRRPGAKLPGTILVGTGGAALVAGLVVGVLQLGTVGELRSRFGRDGVYDATLARTAETQALAANALLAGGTLLTVAGIGVWLW